MTVVKKTKEFTIVKRRDGRFAVTGKKGKPVNGDEKVAILQAEGYLAKPEPKAEEPAAEEEAAEGASEE